MQSTPFNNLVFHDFDAYAAAVEHADVRCLLPSLQQPYWSLFHFRSGPIHAQIGTEGSGNIAEGCTTKQGTVLFFDLQNASSLANGEPLDFGGIFAVSAGREFRIANLKRHSWCSIQIPNELLSTPPYDGAHVIRGKPAEVGELRSLVERYATAAATESAVLTEPAAHESFNAEVLRLVKNVLSCPVEVSEPGHTGRPALDRARLIRQVMDLIDESADQIPKMQDFTRATGASDHTLRTVFVEYFGVSPAKYLQLRRLHRAREMLRSGEHVEQTVGAVAAQCGFWDFGRFAAKYQRLFGESPSHTLRCH